MLCYYLDKEKPEITKILKRLCGPLDVKMIPISQFLNQSKVPSLSDKVIFWGYLRGFEHLYRYCVSNNIMYYYIDHAYLDGGYKHKPFWIRVTKNNFIQNSIKSTVDDLRTKRYFNHLKIKPWMSNNGNYILIAPPSDSLKFFFNQKTWLEDTIQQLKLLTDRPIKIRHKELELRVDLDTGKIIGLNKTKQRPLVTDLKEAYCLITYNSNICVDATLHGIPVIGSNNCAAYPFNFSIENFGNFQEPDRVLWLNSLSYSQVCFDDMDKGRTFEIIDKS